jgi:hypothetical protein
MVKSTLSRSERQFHPGTTCARRVVADEELGGCGVETVSASPVEETLSESVRRTRVAASLAVVCAYLVLGLAAFWSDLPHISTAVFSGATLGDPQLSLWEVAWEHYALLHGLNPFFSHAMFVPGGLNLGMNTATPLLGFITTPLALFMGPVAILNLIAVLAMPISAAAAFFVLRKWNVWLPAAAIGGLVYGFGPSTVGQTLDLHIYLTFLPLPPLIAATIVSILQRRAVSWRLGLLLGVLISAEYLIMPEVVAFIVIIGVAAIAFVAIRRPALVRERAKPVAATTLIAVFVTVVLLAYPVWMLVAGPQHVPTPPHPPNNPYDENDLLNFFVPGPTQRISFGMGSLGNRVNHLLTAENSYIGIPVLLVVGYLAYRSRRVPRVQLASALLLLSALLTLGPHLLVDGHSTRIPLPFVILDHVPVFNSIIPPRMAFGVDTCLAALIAFGLDKVRRDERTSLQHGPRWRWRTPELRNGFLGAGVLVVLAVTLLPQWPYATKAAVTLPTQIRQAVPAGDPVAVTYPYATYFHVQPMVWQVNDDFDFRLLGGYGFHPWPHSADPSGYLGLDRPLEPVPMSPAGLQQFLANQEGVTLYGPRPRLDSSLVGVTRATLSKYDVKVVIVDRSARGSGPVARLFRMALGLPTAASGSFVLWDVRT